MRTFSVLLAMVLLVGCAVATQSVAVPPAADGVRYAADAQWDACIRQTQAELAPQGKCGASNCYDDAGRDLIAICIDKVGYPMHTHAEALELLQAIGEGDVSNVTAAKVRTYPPGHPVRKAYAKAQRQR
jgi:hypothetical protein